MSKRTFVTFALIAATFPVAVMIGMIVAAFFGAEHGANATRYSDGFMIGWIIASRHFATPARPT